MLLRRLYLFTSEFLKLIWDEEIFPAAIVALMVIALSGAVTFILSLCRVETEWFVLMVTIYINLIFMWVLCLLFNISTYYKKAVISSHKEYYKCFYILNEENV